MRQPKSHKIWNSHHPDDPIKPGDGCVIHHIDGNHYNDNPSNHRKMTRGNHRSLHMTGEQHFMFGKKHTKAAKDKMSAAKTGTKHSETWKKNMSQTNKGSNNPFFGHHHTDESKQRISKSHRDKPLSKEHKKNISRSIKNSTAFKTASELKRGRRLSDETRAKMRDGQRKRREKEKRKEVIE